MTQMDNYIFMSQADVLLDVLIVIFGFALVYRLHKFEKRTVALLEFIIAMNTSETNESIVEEIVEEEISEHNDEVSDDDAVEEDADSIVEEDEVSDDDAVEEDADSIIEEDVPDNSVEGDVADNAND